MFFALAEGSLFRVELYPPRPVRHWLQLRQLPGRPDRQGEEGHQEQGGGGSQQGNVLRVRWIETALVIVKEFNF